MLVKIANEQCLWVLRVRSEKMSHPGRRPQLFFSHNVGLGGGFGYVYVHPPTCGNDQFDSFFSKWLKPSASGRFLEIDSKRKRKNMVEVYFKLFKWYEIDAFVSIDGMETECFPQMTLR